MIRCESCGAANLDSRSTCYRCSGDLSRSPHFDGAGGPMETTEPSAGGTAANTGSRAQPMLRGYVGGSDVQEEEELRGCGDLCRTVALIVGWGSVVVCFIMVLIGVSEPGNASGAIIAAVVVLINGLLLALVFSTLGRMSAVLASVSANVRNGTGRG